MKKIYIIKKIRYEELSAPSFWDGVVPAQLTERPWKEYEYHPETCGKLVMSEKGFHLRLETKESFIRAEMTEDNSPVCTDSCMEFFFMPAPENVRDYLNLEVNPKGVIFSAVGGGRHERRFTQAQDNKALNISTDVEGGLECVEEPRRWSVRADIPFEFLEKYFGRAEYRSGKHMPGNFYKCGDKTVHEHYCCWNHIGLPKPDYHCPDWFGELVIE